MKEKLKALWAKVPSFKSVATLLDDKLQHVPGMADSKTTTVVGTPPYQYRKPKKKSFFQKTFRGDERLKLEAYTLASTDAEKEAIFATMKDAM